MRHVQSAQALAPSRASSTTASTGAPGTRTRRPEPTRRPTPRAPGSPRTFDAVTGFGALAAGGLAWCEGGEVVGARRARRRVRGADAEPAARARAARAGTRRSPPRAPTTGRARASRRRACACRSTSPTTSTSTPRSSTRRTSAASFRPGQEPLLPNWRWLPVGYHGRAGHGRRQRHRRRPPARAARRAEADPVFGPTGRLDVELELGFVVGVPSRPASDRRRGVRRARLRRRARERLERARHPGVGVRAARAVPRQVVPDVDLGLGDAARAARAATGRGAAAGSAAACRTSPAAATGPSTSSSRSS